MGIKIKKKILRAKRARKFFFTDFSLNICMELAVPTNFVLPENVSLANDYTMLQKA